MPGLLSAPLDWAYLLRLAIWHGLLPPLWACLSARGGEGVPAPVVQYLSVQVEKARAEHAALISELSVLLDDLAAHRIAAVICQAPLDGAVRQFALIDLLVPRADLMRVRRLLHARGYRAPLGMTPAGERAQLDLGRELLLTRDGGLQQVKIRWGHFGLPVPTAFGPPVRRSAGSRDILTLSADEALVVACAAGATRMWERLVWLHEFAQMVAAHPDVLGAELRERVRRHGAERRWFLGLVLAHDLLDAGPGPEVLEPMRRAPGVSALSAQVQAQMFQEPPGWRRPSSRQRALFHLRARERSRDKVGYALARLMRPSAADAALLPLPRVGGIVRPLRLLGNVGGALAARFFPPAIADLSIFRPTPSDYVNRLLALARVSPDDTVFDLGSGDGRIIILAAQRYGARGVGVEIDPKLVAAARRRARAAGVERRVTFLEGDAKAVNLSPASVVTLYLRMSLKLQPTLKAQLRRGCRIVSLNFDMGDWLPDEVQLVEEPIGESNIFYLWRIGDGRDATSPWGTGAGRAPNAAQDTAARNG